MSGPVESGRGRGLNLPEIARVDRFLQPLVGTTLLLGLLLLWQRTYDHSCVALTSPALVYVAILYGLLEYRLARKRFAVDYYLDRRSSWRRRLRGTWLPMVISMVAALPLAVFLVIFAAFSRPSDWLFLAAAAMAAPFLFDRISRWPGRHFRRDADEDGRGVTVADILSARLAGWVLLALVAVAYACFNYLVIGGPPYIYPDSLQLTVGAFTAGVESACPVVDDGLRAAAALEGSSWYVVTGAATASWMPDGIRLAVWIGFFLNAALAIAGFGCRDDPDVLLEQGRRTRIFGLGPTQGKATLLDGEMLKRHLTHGRGVCSAAPPSTGA